MEPKVLRATLAASVLAVAAAFLPMFLPAPGAQRANIVPPSDPARLTFWTPLPASVLAPRLADAMSDEQLLGQLFLLGYNGSLPGPDILAWIRDHDLGGIKIFGWNTNSLDDLVHAIAEMQRVAQHGELQVPLFVATDQEGGWVRHVRGDTSVTPGNLAIGASRLPNDAYESALYIGRELRALGINMNFAPDVDLYTNPGADVIGPRSFGSKPVDAALLSVAFYRGMSESGIIATAKHFPGHGEASGDSHLYLPVVRESFDQVWDHNLVPYRFLIKEGLPAIMTGHLAYPELDGDLMPATLSRPLETDLLRKRLGFGGLIVTDDLLMGGVQETGLGLPAICIAGLAAGDDLLMISQTPALDSAVWTELLAKMRSSTAFRQVVRTAAIRVLQTKLEYLRGANAVPLYPSPESARAELPDKSGESFFFEQACRSITIVKDGGIPLKPAAHARVLLVGQLPEFLAEGKQRFPNSDELYFSYDPFYWALGAQIARLDAVAANYDLIIFCLTNPNSLQMLESLKPLGSKVVVVSTYSPVYLRSVPWVSTSIAVYGMGSDSFAAGFAVLLGDFPARGTLPVSFADLRAR